MNEDSRKSNRLKKYDYSQKGAYFLTICVKDKRKLLGKFDVGAIINRPPLQLSEYGKVIDKAINEIPIHYPQIIVDKYVIMPNHVHLILIIETIEESRRLIIAPTSISVVVQQMKRHVSKQIGHSIWQKSFYDHVIRSEEDYITKWNYIDTNPIRWHDDEYYI